MSAREARKRPPPAGPDRRHVYRDKCGDADAEPDGANAPLQQRGLIEQGARIDDDVKRHERHGRGAQGRVAQNFAKHAEEAESIVPGLCCAAQCTPIRRKQQDEADADRAGKGAEQKRLRQVDRVREPRSDGGGGAIDAQLDDVSAGLDLPIRCRRPSPGSMHRRSGPNPRR
ncbi:MAG: hypothetical protein EXQ94_08540 [Alphaproteobacteria bacterium]|nr:hypothetical protein [Alphaproteobacteria bacterium]